MSKIEIDDEMAQRCSDAYYVAKNASPCHPNPMRAGLQAALQQRRYTDTPRDERRKGEAARLIPRTCLEYGPIEMPDGTFQHRRRSDGANGLRDVVHNRSDDKRVSAAKPDAPVTWGDVKANHAVDALDCRMDGAKSTPQPAEIFVSRAMELAGESYMNGRKSIGLPTEFSPCTYAGIYRAMRAKEIEEQGTARRKGDPECT